MSKAVVNAILGNVYDDFPFHETKRECYGDLIRVSCLCGYRSEWMENMTEYLETKNKHLGIKEEED